MVPQPYVIPGAFARFVLPVCGSSKKNSRRPGTKRLASGQLLRLPQMRPSETFENFEAAALPLIRSAFGRGVPLDRDSPKKNSLWRPVGCDVLFLMPSGQRFDTSGMQEAVGDTLQKAGVIRNDYSVTRWRAWRGLSPDGKPWIVVDCGFLPGFDALEDWNARANPGPWSSPLLRKP